MSDLTPKQRIFVEAYLTTWNATEAARQAGYKHAHVQGPRLLAKVSISEAVEARIKEAAMETDEVLARLSEQARANIGDFAKQAFVIETDEQGRQSTIDSVDLDWDQIKARGHLVKKISSNANGPAIELHDGQAALIQLGKHLGLFAEKVQGQLDVIEMSVEEWTAEQARRRSQADETLGIFQDADEGENG